jgi:LemA protein
VNVLLIGVAVVAVVTAVIVCSYNRFVEQRQLIANAWSNIDTELQRRHELVPDLVEVVRGYTTHERTTLEAVTSARRHAMAVDGAAATHAGPENQLVDGLRRLLAVSEAYPDLLASEQFLRLHHELVTTEDRIQAARRLFNGNVREYNRRVQSVPSNLVAAALGFATEEYLELEPLVRDAGAPGVDLPARHSGSTLQPEPSARRSAR